MAKTCKYKECDYPVFGKGYCRNHQWKRDDVKKYKPISANKTPIRKVAKSRVIELTEYNVLRDDYMAEHDICEVKGCENPSNQLHHKKGRDGKLLIDTAYFMACCGVCHPRKIHETHVKWAYDNGYLIRRN